MSAAIRNQIERLRQEIGRNNVKFIFVRTGLPGVPDISAGVTSDILHAMHNGTITIAIVDEFADE